MTNTILPASFDYTDKDFLSIRTRVFDLIRSVYPTWSDEAVANFGNVLVESYAWILDVLMFYQDQQAREGRIAFVQLRRNMIALCKLIGYELDPAVAATVDVTLTISNPTALSGMVTPSATPVVVQTEAITDPVKGELQGSVFFDLAAGEISKTFAWEHSITQSPYVVASNNRADQEIVVPFGPFLWGSDEISTPTQGTFTRVDSFFNSGPTDLHYRLQIDQNDRATVIFGDGKNGAIPVGSITIRYKTGGGIYGNVEPGSLVKVVNKFTDAFGHTAYLTATNAVKAENGTPREEVEAARVNAPESTRVLNRTVAREDYEINAKRVPGVGRALMLTSNETSIIGENRGKLFVVPTTGGVPSSLLLQQVTDMLTLPPPNGYPHTLTFTLEVLPPVYKKVNVGATIWLRDGFVPSAVKAAIDAALEDYFEPMLSSGAPNPNVDFGYYYKDQDGVPAGEIPWSDVFDVISAVAGVRKLEHTLQLNGVVDDVVIANWEFPEYGTLVVINGATAGAI